MKTFIILFCVSVVLSGCVVSPLFGPDGRERHEHRDHDDHYSDYHDRDDHRGDPYRN